MSVQFNNYLKSAHFLAKSLNMHMVSGSNGCLVHARKEYIHCPEIDNRLLTKVVKRQVFSCTSNTGILWFEWGLTCQWLFLIIFIILKSTKTQTAYMKQYAETVFMSLYEGLYDPIFIKWNNSCEYAFFIFIFHIFIAFEFICILHFNLLKFMM